MKNIPTLTQLILMNTFKKGDTIWTSEISMIFNLPSSSMGGKISAMSRRGFLRPLFRENEDICWEVK